RDAFSHIANALPKVPLLDYNGLQIATAWKRILQAADVLENLYPHLNVLSDDNNELYHILHADLSVEQKTILAVLLKECDEIIKKGQTLESEDNDKIAIDQALAKTLAWALFPQVPIIQQPLFSQMPTIENVELMQHYINITTRMFQMSHDLIPMLDHAKEEQQ